MYPVHTGANPDFVCIIKKKEEKGRCHGQERRGRRCSPKSAKWNCTECCDRQI